MQDVDLLLYLKTNADCKAADFQIQLTNYQKLTGDIIKGSNYEVEIFKKKYYDMEKKYTELERKVELVFLDQKFHEEIVEDFLLFKKYAEISMDVGGLYDPCKNLQ